MYLTADQEIAWMHSNLSYLESLLKPLKDTLVICPSFVSLIPIKQIIFNTSLKLGAQNCALFEQGAYTGEVSAASLAQIGCTYCIVGHSERRTYAGETTSSIQQKINLLLRSHIVPIICVGETSEERKAGATKNVIEDQLIPLIKNLSATTILIAYEPVWSIGTGIIPSNQEIEEIINFIDQHLKKIAPHITVHFIYGGSITGNNANQLKQIKSLDGFLIGKASTNFEELKKIVL